MTRENKNKVIASIRENIESSKALFLTNLIGITANDAVSLRKNVRDAKGSIVVTRNTLFRKAAEGTYAEELLKDLKGANAVAFAFDEAPAVAKAVYEASKDLEQVTLGKGYLGHELLEASQVSELAKLPSRDEMLGTLLATFNAPISAFARLMNAVKDEIEAKGVANASELPKESKESAEEATAE